MEFENPNPFAEKDGTDTTAELASVGYRYRMFEIGDGVGLIVRCEHDAVVSGPNEENQVHTFDYIGISYDLFRNAVYMSNVLIAFPCNLYTYVQSLYM